MIVTELLIGKATESLAGIFIEKGWKGMAKIGKMVDLKTQQLFFEASRQYIKNYTDRHGILKVLGMREPVALESIYTTVQFLHNSDIRRFESIENLEKAYRENRSFQSQNSSRQDGLAVANEKQYLMVLGGPGVGKSTFLRKIGLEALKGNKGEYKHECIPVFIEMKRINSKDITLEKLLIHEFDICGFPDAESALNNLLEAGQLLILFDGLDEVPSKIVGHAIEMVQNFGDKYHQNRFIISCRTAAYMNNFYRFTDVAMAEFDSIQIKQFIFNWFQSEEDKKLETGQKCWQILNEATNSGAKELANTPLLLTMLCLVYDHSQHFPNNRSALYKKALRVLLEEWAAEKRIMREEIYKGLRTELQEMLLSEIAYTGYEVDQLFFSEDEILDKIRYFLESNLNAPKHIDCSSILQAIAIQQGVLVERAEDVFSFCHLTLQEYLTAQYIIDNSLIEKMVNEHLLDRRWREVFLLIAGLMRGGSDELLLMMEKAAQNQLSNSISARKIRPLMSWVNAATAGNSSGFSSAAKRATALFLATARDSAFEIATLLSPSLTNVLEMSRISDLARAINPNFSRMLHCNRTPIRPATPTRAFTRAINKAIAQELEDFDLFPYINFTALMESLETLKAKAPNVHESYKVHQGYNSRVSQTWLNALQLNPELTIFSSEESNALEDYLYINMLMIRCKQASMKISPKTWQEIEARMLLVSNS
ncbi:MAG: NACHT domain-containing protein [Calothrix sp. CSU_2_0]|nr:NACHT domain-containing protein [Calothrix sp. CSU_2_0]